MFSSPGLLVVKRVPSPIFKSPSLFATCIYCPSGPFLWHRTLSPGLSCLFSPHANPRLKIFTFYNLQWFSTSHSLPSSTCIALQLAGTSQLGSHSNLLTGTCRYYRPYTTKQGTRPPKGPVSTSPCWGHRVCMEDRASQGKVASV